MAAADECLDGLKSLRRQEAGLRVMFVSRQQFKLTLPGKCAQTLDFFGRLVIFTFLTD